MNRGILILVLCVCSLSLLLPACKDDPPVFPNEPGGFRGVIWGQSAGLTPALRLLSEEGVKASYLRDGEVMRVGEVPVEQVTYTFFKDRFASVKIDFEEYQNFRGLKEQLGLLYGPGEQVASVWRTQWWWYGTNVNIQLIFSQVTQKGSIEYTYIPIYEEETSYKMELSRRGVGSL